MLNTIKNWFVHSETIFWARLQIVAGIAWAVISIADLSPLLSVKWFAVWGIFNGIVCELLRRRNSLAVERIVPVEGASEVVKVVQFADIPVTKIAA